MTHLAASELLYNGFQRLDLGLDNPNKAALLIASLLLLFIAMAMRARSRTLAIIGLLSMAALAICLVLTFSRGGLLALMAGMSILLAASWRKLRPMRGWIPVVTVLCMLAATSAWTGFTGRIAHSNPNSDRSVGNRLLIWKMVPTMMVDAPGGWGLGNSGSAFMEWYQPLDRHERYRTLVNSHLTWLTEFGWFGRCAILSGWLLAFGACISHLRSRKDPLPLASLTCLWIAASFSSVLESWQVWIVPAAAMVPAAKTFLSEQRRSQCRAIAAATAGGCAIAATFAICGNLFQITETQIRKSFNGRRIVLGNSEPEIWIVFDPRTMGKAGDGRSMRAFVLSHKEETRTYGMAMTTRDIPLDARRIALCGTSADDGPGLLSRFPSLEEARVLAPTNPDRWLAARRNASQNIHVFCGELSATCPPDGTDGLTTIPGACDYLPTWPDLAFGGSYPVHGAER